MVRSGDLRDEYERLKNEMHDAELKAQSNLNKKRDIMLELREAKQEKNEAKRFQNLKEELVSFLFRHNF
jgi:structural maintenance of chromosome 1